MTAEDLVAQTILQGFDAQYGRFLEITSGAQYRFEQADWHGIQLAMKERIRLYDNHVGLVVEQLRCIRHDIDKESVFLQKVKERYTQLLPNYPRFEIAESFFNSVYCRLFHHRELNKKTYSFFHHNLRIVLRKPLALYQERLLYKVIYPHYCKIFYRAYLCVYRGKINREIFNLFAKRSMRNLAMRNYKMRYFTLLMSYFTVIKRHG